MRRSGKFYSRNEKETLTKLGLTPAPQSGAGWVIKEDGENENVMVQLKSTDGSSYRINMLDIKKLEYHADESNKVPIFLIQFLKQNRVYAVIDVEKIDELYDAFVLQKKSEKRITNNDFSNETVKRKTITAGGKSREQFYKERSERFGRK